MKLRRAERKLWKIPGKPSKLFSFTARRENNLRTHIVRKLFVFIRSMSFGIRLIERTLFIVYSIMRKSVNDK